jgi:hypothetical protein
VPRCIWYDPPAKPSKRAREISRDELEASYRRLLAGDVGQVLAALYSYGRRLVDERRAERDDAPGPEARGA